MFKMVAYAYIMILQSIQLDFGMSNSVIMSSDLISLKKGSVQMQYVDYWNPSVFARFLI